MIRHVSIPFVCSIFTILFSFNAVKAYKTPPKKTPSRIRTLLMLDVDNTLYNDKEVGIESRIVRNTHTYCQDVLHLSVERADELYHKYGSTVEGLKEEIWNDLSDDDIQSNLNDFYHQVYKDIDMSKLLHHPEAGTSSTGYSHVKDQQLVCRLLNASPLPIYLASNSPSWHVGKVLQMMGLDKILCIEGNNMFTPDRHPSFPTKNSPSAFFASSSSHSPNNNDIDYFGPYDSILLFDDSRYNLDRICNAFSNFNGIHINSENSLADALLRAFGLVDTEFEFDQIKYLQSKNIVDRKAMDSKTWNKVIEEMEKIHQGSSEVEPIRIVDVGAGLLSMLDLFIHGDDELHFRPLTNNCQKIDYTAYESNRDLYENCHERLLSWGFSLEQSVSDNEFIYRKKDVMVRFVVNDFSASEATSKTPPHLIVGCCFADLFDPNQLVPSLIRSFNLQQQTENTLLYFPITFGGITQFVPPLPFEEQPKDAYIESSSTIPSDTLAFRLYSKALTNTLGHNLDPIRLQQTMEDYGLSLIAKSSADWKIDPVESPYLFDTMMYFFGTAGGPQILEEGWDAPGWILRSKQRRPRIQVSNVDFLFQIGKKLSPDTIEDCQNPEATIKEILFTAPGKVTTAEKPIPELDPNQVLKLKIFKGMFDDAALDVNIKGMEDERMAYPLAYGYCLVGRIIKGGQNVPSEYIGKLAFAFAPHASHVVADLEGIRLVPDGISAIDAIFMPSVETALSLVHDAHHRIGENIAVYGQGLIGLLVTAILSSNMLSVPSSAKFDTITAFDTIPDRLAAASLMGASQALFPGGTLGPFDVTIEVSGNGRALQSAIDQTADGGRIIVGSWYGNSKVDLRLGIDFHRSHKTIQTSQVSEIPANLRGLWAKTRRFDLTWELVRQLQPSRLLSKTTTLENAQEAYESLDRGTEIAVAFEYSNS